MPPAAATTTATASSGDPSPPPPPPTAAIPTIIAEAICVYLPPKPRLHLATLFRTPLLQAAAYTSIGAPAPFDLASARGQTQLLPLLVRYCAVAGKRPWYTEAALTQASLAGHVGVLEWWRSESGLALKYNAYAMDAATENGRVEVLRWWTDSGLELRYTYDALAAACRRRNTASLRWWRDSGLDLRQRYYDSAITAASVDGDVGFLRCWEEGGLPFDYSFGAVNDASANGHVEVLEWWKGSGLALKYSAIAMDFASTNGHVAVLQWWRESGLRLKYTSLAVTNARAKGHAAVVKWWKDSGLLPDQFSEAAVATPPPPRVVTAPAAAVVAVDARSNCAPTPVREEVIQVCDAAVVPDPGARRKSFWSRIVQWTKERGRRAADPKRG